MIEYRAKLINVPSERPIQEISRNLEHLGKWTEKMLAQFPLGSVEVYCSEEKLMGTVRGPGLNELTHRNDNLCQNAVCGHTTNYHLKTSTASEKKFGACHYLGCRCNKFLMDCGGC